MFIQPLKNISFDLKNISLDLKKIFRLIGKMNLTFEMKKTTRNTRENTSRNEPEIKATGLKTD